MCKSGGDFIGVGMESSTLEFGDDCAERMGVGKGVLHVFPDAYARRDARATKVISTPNLFGNHQAAEIRGERSECRT